MVAAQLVLALTNALVCESRPLTAESVVQAHLLGAPVPQRMGLSKAAGAEQGPNSAGLGKSL